MSPTIAREALERAIRALGLHPPLRSIVIVEDPGAANFAAGLLADLASFGTASVFAQGHGLAQLDKLDVEATRLSANFDAEAFLKEMQADFVLVGTSENLDSAAHALIAACRKSGCASLGFVDGPANVDRVFRGRSDDRLTFAPDRVMVPTKLLYDQFARAGIDPKRMSVVAHPHFASLDRERRRLETIGMKALRSRLFPEAGDRPVVLFLTERSDGLDPTHFRRNDDYTLDGRGGDELRTDIVLQEFLDGAAQLDPRPFIVLRLHPKNQAEEFVRYTGEFDCLSQGGSALEVVYAADAVVGMTTILLSEALVLGKRVLSVVPRREERDWLMHPPGLQVACVWERQAITSGIKQLLA